MLYKILLIGFLTGCFLLVSTFVFSRQTTTTLVVDMPNVNELPRHFRAFHQPHMKISGGGQFSHAGFSAILKSLSAKQITVIDLRQEAHGFLNGDAVSWYGERNAENADKTMTEIEAEQAHLLAKLADQKQVKIARVMQKSAEGRVEILKPISLSVHDVSSEAAWLNEQGQRYFRLYVQDFHAPTAAEADRFVELFKKLSKDQWIYFHCRAGIGRTTTFMMMYDMMLHAKKETFNEIMDRQVKAGGKDLRKLPAKSHYKYPWHKNRLQFLNEFYQYARTNQDHFHTSFSQSLTMQLL
jgi:predicted protein tyrosine phosphatase